MAKESLEEKVKNLERELEQQRAFTECLNLMGKYAFYHATGQHNKIGELFAKKTPGVRVFIGDSGVWEGNEGIDRFYNKVMMGPMSPPEEERKGMFVLHPNNSPLIIVAGDGKTAKGAWFSSGIGNMKDPETGKFRLSYAWGTYGIDFVKEDGEWKFWHLAGYRLFMVDNETGFANWDPDTPSASDQLPDELKPDRPSSDAIYRVDAALKVLPDPLPEPYETFDEKTAY